MLVEVPLAHLDRPFDYLVDARDDAAAQPGVRVKVRFAGRQVGGFVLARVAESDHTGQLGYLERVVSPEPVLTTEVFELARAVAARYAGTLADVLRLAVPPRHARVEKQGKAGPATDAPVGTPVPAGPGGDDAERPVPPVPPDWSDAERPVPPVPPDWSDAYPAGAAFFKAIREGRPARAV